MSTREMTCICCPLGCALTVTVGEDGSISVTGNTCPRGAQYGEKELTNPTRTVTSTVRIQGKVNAAVSVKTSKEIPRNKIMECMAALKDVEVATPVRIGDVLLANVAGTGADIVATRNVN